MMLLLEHQRQYQKMYFIVEPGDFALPVSQRPDATQRTDGSFRPSQLDVARVRAESEEHLGLD